MAWKIIDAYRDDYRGVFVIVKDQVKDQVKTYKFPIQEDIRKAKAKVNQIIKKLPNPQIKIIKKLKNPLEKGDWIPAHAIRICKGKLEIMRDS